MNKLEQTEYNMLENDQYVFFYGSVFSNWAYSEFTYKKNKYNCSEQAMMAEKARLFGDSEILKKIMESPNPDEQKRFGKQVKNYDDEKWSAVRFDVVVDILYEKFAQNQRMYDRLLATGHKKIVEASPSDKIWGIGLGMNDPNLLNENYWKGLNLLGKALMEVRRLFIIEEGGYTDY